MCSYHVLRLFLSSLIYIYTKGNLDIEMCQRLRVPLLKIILYMSNLIDEKRGKGSYIRIGFSERVLNWGEGAGVARVFTRR